MSNGGDESGGGLPDAVDDADSNFGECARGGTTAPCPLDPKPLCFTVSHYRDYANYSWSRFYRQINYHEIGLGLGYRGDPQAVRALRHGYVYIYRDSGLWKVFRIASGQYQEVSVQGTTVNYGASVGSARDHARIDDYFPSEHGTPERICIIESEIRLSPNRLAGQPYSIAANPGARGYYFQLPYSRMLDARTSPLSGAQVLEGYRGGDSGPDLVTYDLQRRTFGGDIGFDLRRPHAFNEARRRNRIYRRRVQRYQVWLNDEDRNKEAYIHQTIAAIIRQDSDRESSINMERYRAWRRNDSREYRHHFFPVHYATESLIEWLDDRMFNQWLLDYNHSVDDDEQEEGLGAYVQGIRELSYSGRGRAYLRDRFNDNQSFFNMATHIPAIRREYTDPAAHSNFAVEVRKTSNVIFAGLQEFAGIIVKESGGPSDAARKLSEWAQRRGVQLQRSRSRAVRTAGTMVSHVDIARLERWATSTGRFADSFGGRSVISFFEVVNLGIAVYGVVHASSSRGGDGYGTNVMFSLLNAAGATADIASTGLFERQTARLIERGGWSASRIHYFAIFSGLVDFVVGVRSSAQEVSAGDYDAAFGWAIFATGGVIVAFGGYLQLTGGTVAVGSGGTAAVPGGAIILLGFVVEAVGLLWVWLANDDELDEWLMECQFGRRSAGRSLDADISALNEVMCKFEVDADFVSDNVVRIEITPRLFTEDTVLELTQLGTSARARLIEYFVGDNRDVVTGGTGQGNVTIYASGATRAARFYREGGRITRITVDLYARQDIDGVSGDARLRVGPGRFLHGYQKSFNIDKGFFE